MSKYEDMSRYDENGKLFYNREYSIHDIDRVPARANVLIFCGGDWDGIDYDIIAIKDEAEFFKSFEPPEDKRS